MLILKQPGLLTYLRSYAVPLLRRLVAGFPTQWPGFEHGSGHVGFVVDKAELRKVFCE
jgi:hypothetical protein